MGTDVWVIVVIGVVLLFGATKLPQLGDGLGTVVPPQVTSVARKPLSIAFEEVAAGKIIPIEPEPVADDEAGEGESAE